MVRASQRSIAYARKRGWLVASTEIWVPIPGRPGGGIRRDAWGWCDAVVLRPASSGWEAVGIQACSMSTRAAHLQLLAAPELDTAIRAWLAVPGCHAELWAWAKRKVKRGGKAIRWELEITPLPAQDRPSAVLAPKRAREPSGSPSP